MPKLCGNARLSWELLQRVMFGSLLYVCIFFPPRKSRIRTNVFTCMLNFSPLGCAPTPCVFLPSPAPAHDREPRKNVWTVEESFFRLDCEMYNVHFFLFAKSTLITPVVGCTYAAVRIFIFDIGKIWTNCQLWKCWRKHHSNRERPVLSYIVACILFFISEFTE